MAVFAVTALTTFAAGRAQRGRAGGSAPEVFSSTQPRPCWIAWDSAHSRYRVPVGRSLFAIGTDGAAVGRAQVFYMDPAPPNCGLNDIITSGEATWRPDDDYGIEFFLTDTTHFDRHSAAGTLYTSKHRLEIREYDATDCAGGAILTWLDEVICFPDTPTRNMDWHDGLDGFVDTYSPASPHCHRPDIIDTAREERAPPSGTGFQSYKVDLYVYKCNPTGGACELAASNTGCFNIEWSD